jgi:uncharacterized Zn finger protein
MIDSKLKSEAAKQFSCPHCGVSAFEVVPEPPEESNCTDSSPSIFMKCLECGDVFRHPIEDVLAALAGAID